MLLDLPFPFTLPRLFRSPAISNFFPFPLGLRNSGVRLYKRITCSQFNFLILHFSLNDVLLVPEKILLKYNDAISNTIFFVTIFLLTIIRRSKVLKKEIKTKHKANKEGWRESNKLSKKGFLQFFLKSGYTN